MAERLIYHSTNDLSNPIEKDIISFNWIKGMAKSRKELNYKSFKSSVQNTLKTNGLDSNKWIEISTYSDKDLGVKLSARNLSFVNGFYTSKDTVENIYQGSKVIEANKITSFKYMNHEYPIEPKTLFYDYIYCLALLQNGLYHNELSYYEYFTDLAFNHNKGKINTQARAAAIFKTLLANNKISIINNYEEFKDYYLENIKIK